MFDAIGTIRRTTKKDYGWCYQFGLGCVVPGISTGLLGQAPGSGPDPREIPVPQIKNVLGTMPGVDKLPMRPELPDIMTMNDGTRVKTAAQWKKLPVAQTFDHFLTMDDWAEAVKAAAASRGARPSDPANPMPGSAPR